MRPVAIVMLLSALCASAEIHRHPRGEVNPHDKYIRVVSEQDSPLIKQYIATRDGTYVAAAIRKPKGTGPFPAISYFHGAPGGRGMDQLVTWSLGTTGGPLWERLLQEGFVVIVSDYRRMPGRLAGPVVFGENVGTNYVEDGECVLEYVRSLPYVDKDRVAVYGVSLGGNLAAYLASRQKLAAVVFGAGAVMGFMNTSFGPNREMIADQETAAKNAAGITAPVLALVGTEDPLMNLNIAFHDLLAKLGKDVQLHIYEGGYHDFVAGPQGQAHRKEPLLTSTLEALDVTVAFLKQHMSAPAGTAAGR